MARQLRLLDEDGRPGAVPGRGDVDLLLHPPRVHGVRVPDEEQRLGVRDHVAERRLDHEPPDAGGVDAWAVEHAGPADPEPEVPLGVLPRRQVPGVVRDLAVREVLVPTRQVAAERPEAAVLAIVQVVVGAQEVLDDQRAVGGADAPDVPGAHDRARAAARQPQPDVPAALVVREDRAVPLRPGGDAHAGTLPRLA
jgi:hypothetical protein